MGNYPTTTQLQYTCGKCGKKTPVVAGTLLCLPCWKKKHKVK